MYDTSYVIITVSLFGNGDMANGNERQRKFRDATALQRAGIPVGVEELANATGRDARDFEGVIVAQDSPALRAVTRGRERRLVRMAGLGDNEGGTIGFALVVEDIKKIFARLRAKK